MSVASLAIEPASASSAATLCLRMAVPQDRPAIYRLRHEVYASELGQHAENDERALSDALDAFNHYIVATSGDEIVGFVSLTPPGHGRYSVDKYVSRDAWPVPVDEGLYEVRLLTVATSHRKSPATPLLMHAALRWIDERGGRSVIAIGRREVLPLYQKASFVPAGRSIRSGAVDYELMSTTIERARRSAAQYAELVRRAVAAADWRLDFPAFGGDPCPHGGQFFRAIGEDFQTLDRRHDVINADVLDAWFPPAPGVLTAVREHLEWAMRTSPPTQCEGLVRAISQARRVPQKCLVPAAGSSALIYLAFREWLDPASRVLLLDPTYGEYRHVLEQVVGCRVDRLLLDPDQRYAVDLDQLEERCQARYDLVVLVNPNNPTGRHTPRKDLEAVLRRAPSSTRFWLDEAYIDYVGPAESLEPFAARSENVVVCKTLSKVYALSGMRAAYLCGPEPIAEALRRVTPPWAIGLPSQIAAVRALGSPAYYREKYRETERLRLDLAVRLHNLGLETVPGTANYLLCHIPPSGPNATTLLEGCRSEGLFLRDVRSMGSSFGTHTFRIAVKDAETNERMIDILRRRLCSV
jgi:histidinol-phosphate/aromatic aminotransferase/cobyric acid decarboxylase-like protein/predicted GNAT family N-acyltransferase